MTDGNLLRMMQTSPYYLVDQIFENENVKTWILLHVTQAGITQDSYGCGIYFPVLFPILHKSGIGTSVGGSKSLADAMVRVIEDNEGVVKSSTEVKEIIVKDGVAMGVKISDGTEFLAKRAVACNIGPTLIFGNGRMIEEEHLDGAFIKQIKHWRAGEVALFTLHLALEEPVMYKASARDPEIQRCYTIGMCESTKTLQRQFNKIKIGEIPKGDEIGFLAVMPTAIDSTQAPPGKHTAFIWQYAPNTKIIKGGAEKWDEVKEEYEEECLEAWGRYTHNLKKPEVILAKYSDTPLDIVRRNPSMIFGDFNGGAIDQDQMGIFRPFHGYLPNKTPIENLYLCGPTAHPSGGCHGGAGYIAANVMAEELKIKKWWPTPAYFGGPPEEEE
ncbi:MAG: hypothetical protein SV062_08650 [Thermodesulfobacteriota bacterium]|nr:hypothetical protein [Thermodesulfobacteriota bacterium]